MYALRDEKILSCLETLHREAARDGERWEARRERQEGEKSARPEQEPLIRMGEFYLGLSEQEGRMVYLLARCIGAKNMVEFGASYGISTLYLGAAARDNGGRLITTEIHPRKCAALRDTLGRAGLLETVLLREGDARQTLANLDRDIDFLLLDGWKSLYLPILKLVQPSLAENALVIADNVDHAGARDYVRWIRQSDSGFFSVTQGDMELSYHLG